MSLFLSPLITSDRFKNMSVSRLKQLNIFLKRKNTTKHPNMSRLLIKTKIQLS